MKNKAIIHLILMLFATAFASCTDEDFLAGELQGTQLADSREVKIAVTETDWQGQTVSLTRAGETLEQLKASSERTWDFTKTPLMDLGVLKADAAKTDGEKKWSYDEGKKQFESQSAFTTLQANGVPLYMTDGLTFSGVENSGDLRIDIDSRLLLNSSGIGITLPSLKKGQKITVEFSTTKNEKSRNIVPSGNVSSTAEVVSTSTNDHAKCEVTMKADGSPTFTVGAGDGGSSVYIYSISVSRAESDGFGLYSNSTSLEVINSHIVWDADIQSWKGISNDAYLMLWPKNVVKSNVSFSEVNNEDVQSNPGYYTFSGEHSHNTKFKECTYDGITFTEGLKMEEGSGEGQAGPTTIKFTNKAVGTVTIVQSDWESDEKPHGTPKTIKFDGEVLDVASAEAITGGRVYTLKNVAAGTHTITRGSGESGIFYVALDIPFTAYAPYIDDGSLPDDPNNVPADYYGIVSHDKDKLVFKPYKDNRIDLMYADHRTTNDGVVELDFKHALGKLSIGTIYNNYGDNITLTQIKLTSSHFCEKGTLNLHTGKWTEDEVNGSYTETYETPALKVLFGTLDIPDKGKLIFPKDVAYTQIPGTTLSFEYTFETDNNTEFTVTKDLTIQQGKNIYININIGQNHEVVLQ